MSTTAHPRLSESDQKVLDIIRHEGSVSVVRLCELLDVTATAIRQRLSRLLAAALIEKVESRQDRGRPVHLYQLTSAGLQAMGDNLSELAQALWAEVIAIEDDSIRQQVIDGVLVRLVEKYRNQITGDTVTERLRSIAALFRERKIPFVVENQEDVAALRIVGCPYPRLNDHGNAICQLEQKLVAALLDAPVALNRCNCESSGGKCCTFSAQAQLELNALPLKQNESNGSRSSVKN